MQNHNRCRPTHAAYEASEAILVAIGGGSMHDSANGLLRIPLLRASVNKEREGYITHSARHADMVPPCIIEAGGPGA